MSSGPVINGSLMREWGIGIVAENRLPSSNTIKVTLLELNPLMQGELADNLQEEEQEALDVQGNPIKSKLRTNTTVAVDWWPPDDYQMDAPMVRRLTKVQIYRYADSKQYYWRTMALDQSLSRGQRYRLGVSATTQESRGANGPYDDHYILDINGPAGMVALTTSEGNKEKAGYTFSIDARSGLLYFGDNLGNYYRLDTQQKILETMNSDGTFMQINLMNMTLNGQETILTTFKDMIDTIGETIKQTAGKTIEVEAGESISFKSPKIFLDGQIYFRGPITQEEGSQGFGTDAHFVGKTQWQGDLTATGTWTINGVVVDMHTHPETGSTTKGPNKG